jgi:hypothetical protein
LLTSAAAFVVTAGTNWKEWTEQRGRRESWNSWLYKRNTIG